jgi:hypothetical protein
MKKTRLLSRVPTQKATPFYLDELRWKLDRMVCNSFISGYEIVTNGDSIEVWEVDREPERTT